MSKRWQDGKVSGNKGARAYLCNSPHPTRFDWNNTPWSCPECGLSVAKLDGPPKRGAR